MRPEAETLRVYKRLQNRRILIRPGFEGSKFGGWRGKGTVAEISVDAR
jgi:hypothetical protein